MSVSRPILVRRLTGEVGQVLKAAQVERERVNAPRRGQVLGPKQARQPAEEPAPISASSIPPAMEWLAEAKSHFDVKNYPKVVACLERGITAGNTAAMTNLGLLRYYGRGVSKNYDEARKWFQQAADAGDAKGMNNLGYLYQRVHD